MARRGGVNISFLDVFCCAMGAAIILAVLFSVVKHPVQIPLRGQFILMEMTVAGDVAGPGVSVTTPKGEVVDFIPHYQWTNELPSAAREVRIWETVFQEGNSNLTRVYFEVRDPVEGSWELRPTMPRWPTTDSASAFSLAKVRLWTRDGEVQAPELSDTSLRRPGEAARGSLRVKLAL